MVTAAASSLPQALLDQLAPQGVLIIPVGEEVQQLLRVTRTELGYLTKTIEMVKFVPLVNGELA